MRLAHNLVQSTLSNLAYNVGDLIAGSGGYAPPLASRPAVFIHPSEATYTYQTITPTGSGTSGSTTITASATVASLCFIGAKIRIGATDIYTIANIVTTTITTVETLSDTYTAGSALAVEKIDLVTDKSGNVNNAAEATADLQPTIIADAVNGRAAIGFDGVDDKLVVPSSASIDNVFANGGTLVFVAKARNAGSSGNGRVFDKNGLNLITQPGLNLQFNQPTTGTTKTWLASNSIFTGGYAVIIMTYNSSDATIDTAPVLYVNSSTGYSMAVSAAGSGTAASDAGEDLYIGNRAAGDRGFNGFMPGFLMYKRVFTAAEIEQNMTYWQNYFGLTDTLLIQGCTSLVDSRDTSVTNITQSAGSVQAIANLANNSITVTQSSGANQPKTGLQTHNGLNVLSFSSASVQFMNYSTNTPLNVPFTQFQVLQSNPGVNVQNFMGRQTSSIPGQWALRRETNSGVFNTFGYGTAGSSQAANASNNNANIHEVKLADNVPINYRINNVLSGTASVARTGYNNAVDTTLALGGANGSAIGSTHDGWTGTAVTYGRILSDAEATRIRGILSRIWGVTLS